ncbi:MAG: hypothetical protein IH948_09000, partial [Bacteroidetes bacterium]|nr:hypothetical protein [Bacteroidota bacterium]
DIYDSLHELEAKCPEICEEYAPEFLWLSWRHLYKVCSNSDNGLIKDIGLFLDKLNLVFFNGLVKIKYYEINNWNFLEPIIQFNWDVMEAVKFDWRFNNE